MNEPLTEPLSNEPLSTEALTSEALTSAAVITEPLTTERPTTERPTTERPTTEPPTTEPPTTEPRPAGALDRTGPLVERQPEAESLAAVYERCRQLHGRHGKTYYLATRLLPAWKRRHVHALYGFARYADDIVDQTADLPVAERAERLAMWSEQFFAGLHAGRAEGDRADHDRADHDRADHDRAHHDRADQDRLGEGVIEGARWRSDPLLPAVLHTIAVFDLDLEDFRKFLASMAMDLSVSQYRSYDDLLGYMEGSAAVIGTMMLPLLQADDPAAAREPARQLGIAFQLTNFIRDVGEDLDRGRLYLPLDDLDRFGLTLDDLVAARRRGWATPQIQALIEYEVGRARTHYAAAALGIPMLAPRSQACIRAAYRIYGGILDEVERQGHDVFVQRAVVGNRRRLGLALASLLTPPGRPARTLTPARSTLTPAGPMARQIDASVGSSVAGPAAPGRAV